MLTQLTVEQVALLDAIRRTWMPVCLSTDPASRSAAENAMANAYEWAGLDPPTRFVWVESPLAGQIQAASMAIERERERHALDINDEIWSTLLKGFGRESCVPEPESCCGESVLAELNERLQGDLQRRLKSEVTGEVWADVRDALSDQRVSAEIGRYVHAQFSEAVRASLGIAAGGATPQPIHDVITVLGGYGQHDAWWFAVCDFFELLGVLETTKTLEPFRQLARSCGQWWAFEGVAILAERPRIISLDHSERLHSESCPAVEYPDGSGFYAWHGVRVPQRTVVDVDSLTVEIIDAEPNGMLHPVLIEAFGKGRYLSEIGATLAHQEARWGSIYHVGADRECTVLHEMGWCRFRSVPVFVQTGRQAWAWGLKRRLDANDSDSHMPVGIG